MEERYISDIKNTSRSIRFKHTLQDDEVVIDANNHEIVEYEYGILNLYDGTFQDTYRAKDADFQELQNAAKKINRFMPFEKYILNLSKIVGFTCYPEDLMVMLVTKKATHNVEVSNKENYEKLVEFLRRKFMQESNFTIENDILHFVYKGSDMLIDLTQLETMSLYQNLVVFVDNGKVKSFPHSCFDLRELTFQLLDNPNFMVCGRRHVVNVNLVKSIYIERDKDSIVERYEDGLGISDKHNVVLTFVNERREYIRTNSWREAERLYHDIDEKLTDLRNAQTV